jgi:hypothetical protein
VLRLEPERQRLVEAALNPGPIEEADHFVLMRLRDPDQNLVLFASAKGGLDAGRPPRRAACTDHFASPSAGTYSSSRSRDHGG